jgi:hypothetical protein
MVHLACTTLLPSTTTIMVSMPDKFIDHVVIILAITLQVCWVILLASSGAPTHSSTHVNTENLIEWVSTPPKIL